MLMNANISTSSMTAFDRFNGSVETRLLKGIYSFDRQRL